MYISNISNTDSYKFSHWPLYPPGTVYNNSYLESRGSAEGRNYTDSVFAGLQYIIKEYLSKPITMKDIERAERKTKVHGVPFNKDGWLRVLNKHNGYLPIRIRAVPEGTVIPLRNALMVVESTDPELAWLVSYVETMLERLWYPMVVATESREIKKVIYKYLSLTSDNADSLIDFMLQDFGSRGSTSAESAAIGAFAHAINFKGSDTYHALDFIEDYYHEFCAFHSVPAGEHSTFSSWGKDRELDAYRNALNHYGKKGAILSVVSDTWDIYNACQELWGKTLKQEVIDSGVALVIRPDSGKPIEVVLRCLELLGKTFGYTTNSKGYKVLNTVKLLQGDGINRNMIEGICNAMMKEKWSIECMGCFGSGGALLQKHDRDSQKVAYKESFTINDFGAMDVYKEPVTDLNKASKKGRLDLIIDEDTKDYRTVRLADGVDVHPNSVMKTYYENGKILVDDTFEAIRERAKIS